MTSLADLIAEVAASLPGYEDRLEAIQAAPSSAAYDDFAQTLMFDLNATSARLAAALSPENVAAGLRSYESARKDEHTGRYPHLGPSDQTFFAAALLAAITVAR